MGTDVGKEGRELKREKEGVKERRINRIEKGRAGGREDRIDEGMRKEVDRSRLPAQH